MNKNVEKITKEIEGLLFTERKQIREAMLENGDRAAWERLIIRRLMVLDDDQHNEQADGGVCTCRKPVATTSTNNQCGCCGKPRRR